MTKIDLATADPRETIITKMEDVPVDASVPPELTAAEARRARFVLRTKTTRLIFFIGIFAPAVFLALLLLADWMNAAPVMTP